MFKKQESSLTHGHFLPSAGISGGMSAKAESDHILRATMKNS